MTTTHRNSEQSCVCTIRDLHDFVEIKKYTFSGHNEYSILYYKTRMTEMTREEKSCKNHMKLVLNKFMQDSRT